MGTTLQLAVCLYPEVTSLDYQGPIELFGLISPGNLEKVSFFEKPPAYAIQPTYLSHNLDPVSPASGPQIIPTATYASVVDTIQYDIILVPGSPYARPDTVPADLSNFVKKQAPGAKHLLLVCTGSWILSRTGILDGLTVATNKALHKFVVEDAKDLPITWDNTSRWLTQNDHKIWTSSGVTAGYDMADAFLAHILGKDDAKTIRDTVG